MEVIETNSPKASFDLIVGPIGAQVDMLRSSSGRAYLAFCDAEEREAVIRRLRAKSEQGPRTAWDAGWIDYIIHSTRQRGYGVRARDYDGLYNDDRASIAMPVIVTGTVLCCINLTWRAKLLTVEEVARLHIDTLRDAVRNVETRLRAALS
jgi:IclR family mhp operon transcriptional activator